MEPIDFKERNVIIKKPDSLSENECSSLFAHWQINELENEQKTVIITSCWKLSPEELEELQRTGCIYLQIMGGMPPVSLFVENPFK